MVSLRSRQTSENHVTDLLLANFTNESCHLAAISGLGQMPWFSAAAMSGKLAGVTRRWPAQPEGNERSVVLDSTGEHEDQKNNHYHSDTAGRIIAPAATVRPGGKGSQQKQDQNNQHNSPNRHIHLR